MTTEVGDVFQLVLPEFPELRFELRYVGGTSVFRYWLRVSGRYRGFSRKYRKRIDCLLHCYFILMVFRLGELHSESMLEKLFDEPE
jgi:hypothetical protein